MKSKEEEEKKTPHMHPQKIMFWLWAWPNGIYSVIYENVNQCQIGQDDQVQHTHTHSTLGHKEKVDAKAYNTVSWQAQPNRNSVVKTGEFLWFQNDVV